MLLTEHTLTRWRFGEGPGARIEPEPDVLDPLRATGKIQSRTSHCPLLTSVRRRKVQVRELNPRLSLHKAEG